MKQFSIFRYVKKLLPLILAFCLLLTGAVYFKLSTSNTYVASEVIHYNHEEAEQGKTPDGQELNVNEIKSSAVLSKVVSRMGLAGIYSVDSLISRFTITPIPDEDKLAQKEAKLEEGEEYVYEPSTFIVSFAANGSEGSSFAREVLDETLDVYFAEFSQKYVNISPANNTIETLEKENYDYLELLEIVSTTITSTLDTLYQGANRSPYFHATSTGLSFTDLAGDFFHLYSTTVSDLFSRIYKYQITRDKATVVSDYTTRIDNNAINGEKEKILIQDVQTVIDAYVEKMRESGNTNITYEYILDNLHERDLSVWGGDQTVTYDELIYSWRNHRESQEHGLIDSAYCTWVIDTYNRCTGLCADGACASSHLTCTALTNEDYTLIKENVEKDLDELFVSLKELYSLTTKTNNEYNEYLGASYISVLSTASVKESVNVTLYTAIAFFFLVVVCCGCAILVGRIADIVEYVFYTDHLTGFYNRAWFDKFLKGIERKILDSNVVYTVVDVKNISQISTKYTRSIGDGALRFFAGALEECFGKQNVTFVYNGNGSFILLLQENDKETVGDTLALLTAHLNEREDYMEIPFELAVGIAETGSGKGKPRKLLSEAMQNKNPLVIEARKLTAN